MPLYGDTTPAGTRTIEDGRVGLIVSPRDNASTQQHHNTVPQGACLPQGQGSRPRSPPHQTTVVPPATTMARTPVNNCGSKIQQRPRAP